MSSVEVECVEVIKSIKISGNAANLSHLLLDLMSSNEIQNARRYELLNEIFSLSKEIEWVDHVQEVLIDIIWLLDLEYSETESKSLNQSGSTENLSVIESLNLSSDERSNLISFVSGLVQTGALSIPVLLERLEPEFLQAIGVIASADLFNKKVVKINTSMNYRQQKYNLLREENEGFSRLVILIYSSIANGHEIEALYERILETIGFFDLDPLKVLDLILEGFVFGLQHWQSYTSLLKKFAFPSSSLVGVLGFKLTNVAGDPKFTCEYLEQVSTVVALLIFNGFIELESVWPYLKPADDECVQEFDSLKQKVKESAKNLNVVNLNASSSANNSAAPSSLAPESLTEQFAQDSLNIKLIPALDSNRNMKAHLVLALLSVGSADSAYKVLCNHPHLAYLNHKISAKICDVIETLLDPKIALPFLTEQMKTDNEFSNSISNWLALMPCGGIFHSPTLFSKLSLISTDKNMILSHLLPALASSSHDGLILAQELWNNSISKLSYQDRFALYGAWIEELYESEVNIFGPLLRSNSISEARKVMRRLAKENVRQYGRLVAKVTHSNPVIVLPLILDQLQAYDNIIPAVVEAFRFLTPLSFDILVFCILRALSNTEKDRLKEDGTNLAAWLQNLSQFTAAIFRKYPQILDPAPLLRYIYSQLVDDNCLDVLVLQELLTQMAGVELPENASELLLEVMTGGSLLQEEVKTAQLKSLNLSGPSKRALSRLKSALQSERLVEPLLVALSQAADAAVYRMDYSHLKLVSTLVDTCSSAFLQYLQFLLESKEIVSLEAFDVEKLVKVNKVELPTALLIAKTFSLKLTNLEDLFKFYHQIESEKGVFIPDAFLKTFWSLDLADISVPMARYQQEIAKNPSKTAELQQEMKKQVGRCGKRREMLLKEKDLWFSQAEERADVVKSVLRMALLPRFLQSPSESIFAAKFLFLLHGIGPQRFSTLSLLDSIFDSLPTLLLPSLTESESHCFGRFMNEILMVLQAWHSSKEKYDREAISSHLPGFLKRWSDFLSTDKSESKAEPESEALSNIEAVEEGELLPDIVTGSIDEKTKEDEVDNSNNPKDFSDNYNVNEKDSDDKIDVKTEASLDSHLNWEDFRHVMFKWHGKLFKCVLVLLQYETSNYTSIRNTIIFLSKLSGGIFPRIESASVELESVVLELKSKENREDLKVLATRYYALLTQNKLKLMKEYEFHHVEGIATEIPVASDQSSPSKKRQRESEIKSPEKRPKTDRSEKRRSDKREVERNDRINDRHNNNNNNNALSDKAYKSSSSHTNNSTTSVVDRSNHSQSPINDRRSNEKSSSSRSNNNNSSRDSRNARDSRSRNDYRDEREDDRSSRTSSHRNDSKSDSRSDSRSDSNYRRSHSRHH